MNHASRFLKSAAAAASLVLVGFGAPASAQYGNEQYCSNVAWTVCSHDENGRPIQVTLDCYDEQFNACMSGYASLQAKKPAPYDRRQVLAAAATARPHLLR